MTKHDNMICGGGFRLVNALAMIGCGLALSLRGATLTVTTTADAGTGSLRQAILNANSQAGADIISFDLPNPTARTISPISPLPFLTSPLTVDGSSAPGVTLNGATAGTGAHGLVIESSNVVVRGLVIHNFAGHGIMLSNANHCELEGNYIGTDATGATRMPNDSDGIHLVFAPSNTISASVIAGNRGHGIILIESPGVQILGNRIGNGPGTPAPHPLNNSGHGVFVASSSGVRIADGNIIGPNSGHGVYLFAATTHDCLIWQNYLGVDHDRTTPLGNGAAGIGIHDASSNQIGGPNGAANWIAHNAAGVTVAGARATNNAVRFNSIHSNSGLGIDLDASGIFADGVTPNDASDTDTGPNGLQNFPVLSLISQKPSGLVIEGSLHSRADTPYTIDFYASGPCDTAGSGSGQIHLGMKSVTTDAGGVAPFSVMFPPLVPAPRSFTATATDPAGNTSEFSTCAELPIIVSSNIVVRINGAVPLTNSLSVASFPQVELQTAFPNGTILYTLNGAPPNTGPLYAGPILLTQSATVRAVAFSSDYMQSAESDPVSIDVRMAPLITAQPVLQSAVIGGEARFDVMASGSAPLSYQWWRNSSPVSGATSASLLLSTVSLVDAGNYLVVVSNVHGTAISDEAMLNVLVPPGFTTQPASTNVPRGGIAAFCVMASGSPALLYQWRKNGVNIRDATNACFVITNVQVADGGIYSVVVANGAGAFTSDDARLVVDVPPRAPGDNFADRVAISNAMDSVSGTNLFATREPGELDHAGKAGGVSVWYQWKAPFSGVATFNTRGSAFDTLLAIYTGTSVNSLTNIAGDEDDGGFGASEARFNAQADVEYAIAIDGFAGAQGDFVLSWELQPGPLLPVITNQPQPQGQTVTNGAEVILSVTALGSSLTYHWRLNGTNIPNATNALYTIAQAGAADVGTYIVRVSNALTNVDSEPVVLEVGPPAPAVSQDKLEDLFRAPSELPGFARGLMALSSASSGFVPVAMGTIDSQTLNNIGASGQQGEPPPCGVIGGSSKWFGLRPEADGIMQIDTIGSSFDTVLAVYTGTNNIFSLKTVDCDNNGASDGIRSLVQFAVRRGTNYSIAVDGVNGVQGSIQLNWRLGTRPNFTSATETAVSARMGDSLVLEANVGTATADLAYRWLLDGQPITGANTRQLLLGNLLPIHSGMYHVIAHNFAGSVTGLVATVTVAAPIQVMARLASSNGAPIFQLSGGAGRSYVIEVSSNLVQWLPVYTNAVTFGPLQFLDSISTGLSRRFYRVLPWP